MSEKVIRNCMLIIAICCLILGGVFKILEERYLGIEATTGVMIDGEYQSISSGRIGANQEEYERFNTGGNLFFIFAGITGVVGIVMLVSDRRK